MTLQLKTFGPAFGEVDASPFCAKAIYLLNMAGVQIGKSSTNQAECQGFG